MDLIGFLLFFALLIISYATMRFLRYDQTVGQLFIGSSVSACILIILAGYILDVILKVEITTLNTLLLISPIFVGILLFAIVTKNEFAFKFEIKDKRYFSGLILVFIICMFIGLIPSYPSILPIGSGDTQHHYAAANFIYENGELPRDSSFYTSIHHGLVKYVLGKTPLGYHLVVSTISMIIGIEPIFTIYGITLIIGGLISVLVYEMVYRIRKDVLIPAFCGIFSFVSGLASIAMGGGTLYMLLGFLFTLFLINILMFYDEKPNMTLLFFIILLNNGIILSYTPMVIISAPLTFILLVKSMKRVDLKSFILPSFVGVLSFSMSGLCIGNIYSKIMENESTGFVARYGGIFSKLQSALFDGNFDTILCFGVILFFLLLYVVYTNLKLRNAPQQKLNSFYIVSIIFAIFPAIYLIFHPNSLYYQGYHFWMYLPLLAILIISIFTVFKSADQWILKLSIGINNLVAVMFFTIYYPFNLDGYGLYYYSKHIMFAACIIPVLLPTILSTMQVSLARNVRFKVIQKNILSKLFKNHSSDKKFPHLFYSAPAIILLLLICTQTILIYTNIDEHNQGISIDECQGLIWMRDNYIEIFPSDEYEYYMILDNHRARWFIAIGQHQFNMRSIKGDWIHYPWPLSLNLDDFCERAKQGDVIVLDKVIDKSNTKLFDGVEIGNVADNYESPNGCQLRLLDRKGPLLFVELV